MCNLSRSTAQMSLSRIAGERGGGRVFFCLFCKLKPTEAMGVNGVTAAQPLAFSFSVK